MGRASRDYLWEGPDPLLPETPLHLTRRAPTEPPRFLPSPLSLKSSAGTEIKITKRPKNKASAVFNSGGEGKPRSHRARRGMAGGQTQGRATPVRQSQTGRAASPDRPPGCARTAASPLRGGPGASACSSEGPRGARGKRAGGCLHPPAANGRVRRKAAAVKEPLRGGHLPLARTRSRSGALRGGGRRGTGAELAEGGRRRREDGGALPPPAPRLVLKEGARTAQAAAGRSSPPAVLLLLLLPPLLLLLRTAGRRKAEAAANGGGEARPRRGGPLPFPPPLPSPRPPPPFCPPEAAGGGEAPRGSALPAGNGPGPPGGLLTGVFLAGSAQELRGTAKAGG